MTVVLLLLLSVVNCWAQEDTVNTTEGFVRGTVTPNHREFLGIPFAAAPVGKLRGQDPQPHLPWGGVRNCMKFAPSCPQDCTSPPRTCPDVHDEDCLYLNVYTPRVNAMKGKLPVMLWLYGGNNQEGGGGWNGGLYDGSNYVGNYSVIMVTTNYRLGVLGWLATNAKFGNFSGNAGFMDQIASLKWIQRNIANFGGDPNAVTIFGQSAGGTGIRGHLVSPASTGLFHGAISQSDPFTVPFKTREDALGIGNAFLEYLGCEGKDINCFLQANVSAILKAQHSVNNYLSLSKPAEMFYPWIQVIDENVIPMQSLFAFQQGKYNKVPVIFGHNKDDALSFIYGLQKFFLPSPEYLALLGVFFNFETGRVLEHYPTDWLGDNRPIITQLGTDYIWHCNSRYLLSLMKKWAPNVPVYIYQYNHVISFDWMKNPECVGKVCHASELILEFDIPGLSYFGTPNTNEKVLMKQFGTYWTNFAKTGNPNNGQPVMVNWPDWNSGSMQSLGFDYPAMKVESGFMNQTCAFWDGLGYHYGW